MFKHCNGEPEILFATLVENLLPTGLIGLVLAGLVAAVMSHISGAINSSTTILTMDIYLPYIKPGATQEQAVRFGRLTGMIIIVLGICCTGLLMLYAERPIFIYLLNAYGYFTPGIATMFLLGILWKRTTHTGAVWAGLLTIPLSLLIEALYPDMPFLNRTGIVFWVCMLVCAAVSLVTKPKPAAELRDLIWNRESLTLPPDQKAQQKGLRNPALWWAIVTAVVLYFYIRYA